MLFKTFCATCVGIDAVTVTVEIDISPGVGINMVGLPDSAVRESISRIHTALASYGYRVPGRQIVVNLAPADIKKEGSSYDLAIAIGIIAGSEQAVLDQCGNYIIMGELSLDGNVRDIVGALPIAVHAKDAGYQGCIFPAKSAVEASDIDGINIYGVHNLSEVIDILSGQMDMSHLLVKKVIQQKGPVYRDFKNVMGQEFAKRGLEIAASAGHNLIMIGSPGSGKTFMASCLPSILPPMSREESIETSKIYSVYGKNNGQNGLMFERPFRSPHHSASIVSLIGGGTKALPGEISLANNGVLYLDELAQFPKSTLDALRQPIEDGKVTISRAKYKVIYPSSFMLIASMNPCPCGYYGDGTDRCQCTQTMIAKYLSRVSGPMMDRIDMHIYVNSVPARELVSGVESESSSSITERVVRARLIQQNRFKDDGIFTNSQMDARLLSKYCKIAQKERDFLQNVIEKLNLSARAYSRVLKLARTIADLRLSTNIEMEDIAEAVQFRNMDRRAW